jgi:hypothetical protein
MRPMKNETHKPKPKNGSSDCNQADREALVGPDQQSSGSQPMLSA